MRSAEFRLHGGPSGLRRSWVVRRDLAAKEFMNPIKEMLVENDGSVSLMRVVVLMIVLAVLVNWVFLTVHTGQRQDFGMDQIVMVLGALGLKVCQKPLEKEG